MNLGEIGFFLFIFICLIFFICLFIFSFPCSSVDKRICLQCRDPVSIPGSRRSPGEGNGNPLQYSCLENPMDRGTWQATVHGVPKSQTQLSD